MGKKVIIVTGCFDLLTNSHIRFLKQAKAHGDVLVVGLEDDNRIRAFKGKFRPVNTISQRVEVIEAIEFVDYVFVIYGSPKFEIKPFYTRLHNELKADFLAVTEGDEYMDDRREEIESANGKLIVVSKFDQGTTSSLIRQFLKGTIHSDFILLSKSEYTALIKGSGSSWKQLSLPLPH